MSVPQHAKAPDIFERLVNYHRFLTTKEVAQLLSVSPKTIADGLVTSLGPLTFEIIQKYIADIITVEEAEIKQAMRHVWERMKLIIEPSSAVPVAAVLSGKIDLSGKRVGIIFSGGNVDLDRFFNDL